MPYEFKLPPLSSETEEGIVVAWFKREGATVTAGEKVLEVQLAKVSYDVPAPVSGTLYKILAPRDAVIKQGQVMALILEPGEAEPAAAPTLPTAVPAPAPPSEAPAFIAASPAARRLAREHGIDLAAVKGTGPEGRISEADVLNYIAAREQAATETAPPREARASPLARRLAQEYGIDLATITPSSPDGRIGEQDVRAAIEAREKAKAVKTEPLSPIRRTIARRMTESLQTTAQLTLVTEAEVTEIVALREQLQAEGDITYTDLIIKAVALALVEHPRLNARFIGDALQLLTEINIGVAVALDDGLIVPVIRQANQKTLRQIAAESKALAARAREGRLAEQDLSEGTFTVTNLGMYGIDAFTPILNLPQVAILGVGRIFEQATRKSKRGGVLWKQMMTLSLTFDHRALDGAPAAAFLQTVCRLLAHPAPLMQ